MFLISDTLETRQEKIRGFLHSEPVIAVLLAAADFEWTIRRAILALGKNPTKHIREHRHKLYRCSSLARYSEVWNNEVKSRFGDGLPSIIHEWEFFNNAFKLRHRLIHGESGTTGTEYAKWRVEAILNASKAVVEYADSKGEPVYGRRIVRRKAR
jgi:hypothetical protein